jgi:hypothetical protein
VPHIRQETPQVWPEVSDDPGEVSHVLQEPGNNRRKTNNGQSEESSSMKLLTWNTCRLLAGGRELALVTLLQATGADIATISECKIPEGTGEFSVAGYTTFTPPPSAGGKTRVIVIVENSLAVRANVKVVKDIMDPSVQSV